MRQENPHQAPSELDQRAGLPHKPGFDDAREAVYEGGARVLFGSFFKGEICHDDGMGHGILYAEISLQAKIGEVDRTGFIAGSENGDHAGDFW